MIITAFKLYYNITVQQPYQKCLISNKVIYSHLNSENLQMQTHLCFINLKCMFCLLKANFKPTAASCCPDLYRILFLFLDSRHCSGLSLTWQILGKLLFLALFSVCLRPSSNIFQLKKTRHEQWCPYLYRHIQKKFAF